MESVNLNLTEKQMKKLATGGAIMVSPAMVGGAVECMLNPGKMARMKKNHEAGKKFRLTMDQSELKGGSFKGFMRKLKKGAKKLWQGYKTYVKPSAGPYIRQKLKEGTHAGLEIGAAALTGDPEAVAVANAIATELERVIDWIGNQTGAYSVNPRYTRRLQKGGMVNPALPGAEEINRKIREKGLIGRARR